MSATDVSTAPTPTPSSPPTASAGARLGAAGWLRVAVACAILLGSAVAREWQSRRIEGELRSARDRPKFDLDTVPMDLGRWNGSSTRIDEQIARGTGADQVVTRRYVNRDTGAAVDMILLYGPAAFVYLHAPEICYPAAGFGLVAGPEGRTIDTGKDKAPFRTLVYSKGEGALANRQEVYYSWWYNGQWNPNIGNQKQFERIPGMFKVHLARPVTSDEKRDVGNPCESLLRTLLPEIERRMATAESSPL